MHKLRIRRCVKPFRAIILIILCMGILSFFLPYNQFRDSRPCFFSTRGEIRKNQKETSDLQLLKDVLEAEVKPKPDKSIFFIDTTCNMAVQKENSVWNFIRRNSEPPPSNSVNLTIRAACSIESAALHNPSFDVFVLFTQPAYQKSDSDKKVMKVLQSYPNVHFRFLDLENFVSDTPVNDWFWEGHIFTSLYPVEHTADLLRLLVLWRWGGIYLDTDVILLRNLTEIFPNFMGAESNIFLNVAVLGFSAADAGHDILTVLLNDFQSNYKAEVWGHNGPELITRVMKKICQVTTIFDMFENKRCMAQVLKEEAFYPIKSRHLKKIFEEKLSDSVLNSINGSYAVHLWNRYSKMYKLGKGNLGSLYNKMASENCPQIYALAKEFD